MRSCQQRAGADRTFYRLYDHIGSPQGVIGMLSLTASSEWTKEFQEEGVLVFARQG